MKLLLDPNGVNYTSVMPLFETFIVNEKDQIDYAKAVFEEIQRDGIPVLVLNHPKRKFRITVAKLNGYVYLIQSVKTENYSKNNLYFATENHVDDFIKIAKYLESVYYGTSLHKH